MMHLLALSACACSSFPSLLAPAQSPGRGPGKGKGQTKLRVSTYQMPRPAAPLCPQFAPFPPSSAQTILFLFLPFFFSPAEAK